MTAQDRDTAEELFDRLAKVVQLPHPMKALAVSLTSEELFALERLVTRCERLQWYATRIQVGAEVETMVGGVSDR